MHSNFVLLAFCCYIAFTRPVWGVSLVLILTSSLFNLSKYVSVALPVGYMGAHDVLVLALLAGAYRQSRLKTNSIRQKILSNQCSEGQVKCFHEARRMGKVLVSAIAPYLLWVGICGIRGILGGGSGSGSTIAIRGIMNFVLPWSMVAIVWWLRGSSKEILKAIMIIVGLTAFLHIVIQVFDLRSIVPAAYWASTDESLEVIKYDFFALENEDFLRYLPQGLAMMILLHMYSFGKYLSGDRLSDNRRYLAVSLLLLAAFATTYSRAILSQAFLSMGLAFFLLMSIPLKKRNMGRVFNVIAIVFIFAFIYIVINSSGLDFWFHRFSNLGLDSRIFSEETGRGQVSLGAICAIKASPVWGWGSSLVPDEFKRIALNDDALAFFQVALFGGIIAVVLLIRLFFVILGYFIKYSRQSLNHRIILFPYFAVFATVFSLNIFAVGSTFSGVGLMAMAIFIGLMAAETVNAVRTEGNFVTKSKWEKSQL